MSINNDDNGCMSTKETLIALLIGVLFAIPAPFLAILATSQGNWDYSTRISVGIASFASLLPFIVVSVLILIGVKQHNDTTASFIKTLIATISVSLFILCIALPIAMIPTEDSMKVPQLGIKIAHTIETEI